MSTQLRKIAAKAQQDPQARCTALAHLLTPEFLRDTWRQLNRKGASGIDGETIAEFATNWEARLQELWRRLRAGQYHAPPGRRVEMPQGHGTTRPLGMPIVCAYCISSPRSWGILRVEATHQDGRGSVHHVSHGRNGSQLAARRCVSIRIVLSSSCLTRRPLASRCLAHQA